MWMKSQFFARAAADSAFAPPAFAAAGRGDVSVRHVAAVDVEHARFLGFLGRDAHAGDPYLTRIGPGLRKTCSWRIERAVRRTLAEAQDHHERYARVAAVLLQTCVTIAAGTDAGFLDSFSHPGTGLRDELDLPVKN